MNTLKTAEALAVMGAILAVGLALLKSADLAGYIPFATIGAAGLAVHFCTRSRAKEVHAKARTRPNRRPDSNSARRF